MTENNLAVFWVEEFHFIPCGHNVFGQVHSAYCDFCRGDDVCEKWIFYFSSKDKGTRRVCSNCLPARKKEFAKRWFQINSEYRMVWRHKWLDSLDPKLIVPHRDIL